MSENHKNTLKTAWNDVTGDTINNSLKSDQKKFDSGWNAIWGNKKENVPTPPEDKNDIAEYQMSLVNKMIEEMESTPEGKAEMDALRERLVGGCTELDYPVQLHPYAICPDTGNLIYQLKDVLEDETHPAHYDLKEMVELIKKGELYPS